MQQQTVIPVGNRNWIAGLHWLATEEHRRQETRRQVRAAQADHYIVIKQDGNVLIGTADLSMTELSSRQRRQAFAIAPQLLHLLGENGWAIFNIDRGQFYFLASINGQMSLLSDIAGDKDCVSQALARYLGYTGEKNTKAIYCPSDFWPETMVPEGNLVDLLCASSPRKDCRLRARSKKRPVILWVLAFATLAVVWYGISEWQEYQYKLELEARRSALAAARSAIKRDPPKPWKQVPVPEEFIHACRTAWNVPVSLAGWLFREAQCGMADGQLVLRLAWYRPEGGTLETFKSRLAEAFPGVRPVFNIPGAADTGGVRIPVTISQLQDRDESAQDAEDVTQRLTNYAQQIAANLNLTENSSGSVLIDGNMVELPWRTFSFQLQTEIPPDRLFGSDFNSAGVRLSTITMTLNDARLYYSLEGTLYATR